MKKLLMILLVLIVLISSGCEELKGMKEKIIQSTVQTGCPQINVLMGELQAGNEYDGWAIKSDDRDGVSCRKGNAEGENVNYYYCGGYDYAFGINTVIAYVEKTIISDDGEIGETRKYAIGNIYDENKDFVETRCIGNPDEIKEEDYKRFEEEALKWNSGLD